MTGLLRLKYKYSSASHIAARHTCLHTHTLGRGYSHMCAFWLILARSRYSCALTHTIHFHAYNIDVYFSQQRYWYDYSRVPISSPRRRKWFKASLSLSLQLARHEATTLSTGYCNFHRTDSSRFTGSTHLLQTISPGTSPSLTHQLKCFDD